MRGLCVPTVPSMCSQSVPSIKSFDIMRVPSVPSTHTYLNVRESAARDGVSYIAIYRKPVGTLGTGNKCGPVTVRLVRLHADDGGKQ